ncbi:hypothetical protein ACWEWX_02160 [Streptomyces asiaticus]
MTDQSAQLKAAYERLDECVREITRLEEWDGLVTDWVVLAASQYYSSDGRLMSDVGQILPDGGTTVPVYRIVGLLQYALMAYATSVAAPLEDDED